MTSSSSDTGQTGLALVIDLSASLYLALLDSKANVLSSRIREQGARGETAHILLDECLEEINYKPKAIEKICVGIGPGSFTGIRVGIALTQGFAFARQLPIYPFSSLTAMVTSVATISKSKEKHIVAAIAANGGQYFVRTEDPVIEALIPGAKLISMASQDQLLVTSGRIIEAERLGNIFGQVFRLEECIHFQSIFEMATLNPPILDGVIRPNYLQVSAAEEKRRLFTPENLK